VWQVGYPSKYLLGSTVQGYYHPDPPRVTRFILRTAVALGLFPLTLWDLLLGRGLKLRAVYAKPLDSCLIDVLRAKVGRLVDEHAGLRKQVNAQDTDWFRLVYHYVLEHAPNHGPKMQNYVALYGFLRTQSFLYVIFFWLALILSRDGYLAGVTAVVSLLSLSGASYVAFMGFMKFYRRFSLEALMALSAIYPEPEATMPNNRLNPTVDLPSTR
jgi:hypothetical protein